MIINKRHVSEFGNEVMHLGYVGENEHTRFIVDCSPVFSEYPDAVPAMTVQPPAGNAYPAVTRREGNDVIWDVVDSDLAMAGDGKIQLTFTENTKIIKSCIGYTRIHHSLLPKNKIPTPVEDWLVEANSALNSIPKTIDDALKDAKESGEFDGPPGPKGDKGDPGSKGDKGDTGDAFTYDDFTPEQLAGLTGPKGDKGDPGPKGDTGDAFTYDDFTPEQLAGLTGPKGDKGDPGPKGDTGDAGPQGLRGKTGVQGPQGDPGKDFHIAKTFISISEMMSYSGSDIEAYDFVMIDTGSVQDPDTGKLYCYDPSKIHKWQYIGDLSGAQGIKGEKGDKGDSGDPTELIDDTAGAGVIDKTWSANKIMEELNSLRQIINSMS